MTEKLCVFISYKREDQAEAEQLWQLITEWGYEGWLDVRCIQSGISRESSTWIDSIHTGLKRSVVLIGFITPQSLQSQNVKDEWYWARKANRRILLLRLRPFEAEDMPPPFAETDYIDLYTDREKALVRLKNELDSLTRERESFQAEITPPAAPPEKPKLPGYLLDDPKKRYYAPWQMTLRFLGIITLPIAFLWLLFDLGFESLLAFLGAIAALLASQGEVESADADLSRSSKLTDYQQMGKRIYQYWVQGVMQTALKEVEAIGIGLNMQPEAVVRDTRKNMGDIGLPNDSRHVRHVYDTFKSFLILGDPGAGKTIMLLQLAESLILKPPPTHKDAIPLVLNLSSWSLAPKPLHDWLEDEVWRTYRVRGNRVRGWLSNNQLILLLDGLDEVKEEQRAECVVAINTFRQANLHVPLVVCSRIEDYNSLGDTKLELPGAILLEALSEDQIDQYLSDPQLVHLKRVTNADPILREMSRTPFLLNTMIYAYRNEPEAAISGFITQAARREHLFTTYVMRRLKDDPSPYDYQQTLAYLQWLATKMQAYVQTVFHLEDIQPDWAADDPLYPRIINRLRRAYAVMLTLLYAVVGWQMSGVVGLLAWAVFSAFVGFIIIDTAQFRLRLPHEVTRKLKDLRSEDRNLLLYIVLVPPVGLVLAQWFSAYTADWLAVLISSALLGWLFIPLFGRYDIKKWEDFWQDSLFAIAIGLWIGGIAWSIGHVLSLPLAVSLVLVVGHGFGFEKVSDSPLPQPLPTLRHVLFSSLLAGLVFGLTGIGMGIGPILGIAAAVTYAGLFNGLTLLYPLVLWVRVRQRRKVPLRLPHFLNSMAERQILRQMGGGYIFIHRYLLENFAGVDEFYLLWEQLKDKNRREKAQQNLSRLAEDISHTLVPLIQAHVSWEQANVHPLQRDSGIQVLRNLEIEILDLRPGVGLDARGLPDIDWLDIPGGKFIYQDGEKLTLQSFHIARYPVTYAQFQTFVDAADYEDERWWVGMPEEQDGGFGKVYKTREMREQRFKYSNHPRENVSWYQAVAFCRWLSEKLGYEVRLPTEAEWEKAARGPEGLIYPYGDEFDATKANTSETGIRQTSAVGIFPDGASPYGVMDMSGNVFEWCLNKYDSPEHLDVDDSGDWRVLHGGSWEYDLDLARAASRYDVLPYFHLNDAGFRVCSPYSLNS